ncbi:hypothetical protein M1D93_12490 [Arthrobacter sp. Z1-9]
MRGRRGLNVRAQAGSAVVAVVAGIVAGARAAVSAGAFAAGATAFRGRVPALGLVRARILL